MSPTRMMPPFPHFGAKTTIADRIVSVLPAHSHYVEPYAGSLSVLFAKPRSVMETVNDLDQGLMTWWRVLRDRPADLARVCALTPHSRAEFELAATPATDDLEQARRVWVRLTQGRGGMLLHTGWRHYKTATSSATSTPGYLDGYVDRLAALAGRLHAVSLECRPALEIIAAYGRAEDVLLYVDPPYLGSTRAGGRYRHEMAGPADHEQLAETLHQVRAAVVLSGYPSALYERLYAGWDRIEISSHTHNARAGATDRTEVLWSNRSLVTQEMLTEEAS